MLVTGMAYVLLWSPVVRHTPVWLDGNDLWGIWRGAHDVGWGYFGGMYAPSEGLVSFPGITVLLAPLAACSSWLGLSESTSSIFLAKPTAILLLQPVELLLAGTAVFAADALADRLGVTSRRRIIVCLAAAAVAWPVATLWGHAEDMLSMTFAVYGLIAAMDRKWMRCGWLFGVGIAFQPLVALIVPIVIASSPPGRRVALVLRSALLSVVLVGFAFLDDPGDTFRALVLQPTAPAVNHPTPWVSLAPVVSRGNDITGHLVKIVHRADGRLTVTQVVVHGHSLVSVSGGAGRLLYLFLALSVAVYAWRRPQPPERMVWMATAVLAGRCAFEAVMTPYYLAPPLLLVVVLAAMAESTARMWLALLSGTAASVFAYQFLSPWLWWTPIVVLMAVALWCGFPTPAGTDRDVDADRAQDAGDTSGPQTAPAVTSPM